MSERTPLLHQQPTKKKSVLTWLTGLVILGLVVGGVYLTTHSNQSGEIKHDDVSLDKFPEADSDLNNLKMYSLHVKPTIVNQFNVDCKGLVACNVTVTFQDIPEIEVDYLVQSSESDVFEYLELYETLEQNTFTVHVKSPSDWQFYHDRYHLDKRHHFKLQVLAHVIVPKTFFPNFDMDADLGLLDWHGIYNHMDQFHAAVHVGAMKIKNIKTKSFNMETNASAIQVENISADKDIIIVSDVGSIHLENALARNVELRAQAGEIYGKNVVANEDIVLKTDAGKLVFYGGITKGAKSGSVNISTNAGEVSGSIVGYKTFNSNLNVGSIDVELKPLVDFDSKTTLTSDAGTIKAKMFDFSGTYDLESKMGTVKVTGDKVVRTKTTGGMFGSHKTGTVEGKQSSTVVASTNMGTISLDFQ
ncbi:hypothetical protein HDV02_001520 [Globomyces sp. JEL0801]|nr:hypothetical protein HDV02_001520 [Globomyces sp. JEL0801]